MSHKCQCMCAHLDLVSCDADPLGDELFLDAVRVSDGDEDAIEKFQLVASVTEPLAGRWRRDRWIICAEERTMNISKIHQFDLCCLIS